MDPLKVLGGLLNQRAARSGGSGSVLGQILEGIADARGPQQRPVPHPHDPRFSPRHHEAMERIVRESIHRNHQAGCQQSARAQQWIQRGGGYVQPAPPPVHGGHHHDHPCGLSPQQRAEILIRAMIMASQADGMIEQAEQAAIVTQLQPLDRAEAAFLQREFNTQHDVHAFAHTVPSGMEHEVYCVSLMAINLDTQCEAEYLRQLASCLRIEPSVCNYLHQQCGVPVLYR